MSIEVQLWAGSVQWLSNLVSQWALTAKLWTVGLHFRNKEMNALGDQGHVVIKRQNDLGLVAFIISHFTTLSPSTTGGTEVQLKNVGDSINSLQATGQPKYIFHKSTVSSLPIKSSRRSSFTKVIYGFFFLIVKWYLLWNLFGIIQIVHESMEKDLKNALHPISPSNHCVYLVYIYPAMRPLVSV